ncbi:MAG: mechanosensitive ion channel [Bacteroidales bacterium]|nr:mechanosensitive ion channel [Bacteroidales bacterium]
MSFLEFEFSGFAVYSFLFIAIVIFFLFRLLNTFIPIILKRKEYKRQISKYLPVVEIFIWFIYIIWAVQFFWNNNQLYAIGLSLILFILILWIFWFALRDYIAGAIFKTSKSFSINEFIKINDYKGKIISLRNRSLVLETETGERIFIPYNYVLGQIIIKSHPSEMILSHTFKINISIFLPINETIDKIKAAILNLPWSSVKEEPQIKAVTQDNTCYTLEIIVYSYEKKYFFEMENFIKDKFDLGKKIRKLDNKK